ncbi:MAG: DUF2905 domain-containing protein [Ketobacter sp.]|nr:DUF2905 domain-containing protein [Ketobacter sp.]
MGKLLIIIGVVVALIGLVLVYAPGLLSWFGKLPGDLRWGNENGGVFFPVTSMIIISVVLTLIMNVLGRH